MKQKSYIRLLFIIIPLLILLTYSSEMHFMPNYTNRPDKWYLLTFMILFYLIIFLSIIWTIFKKDKGFQKAENLFTGIVTLVGFAMLNNPKGYSQLIGYLVIFIVFIFSMIRIVMNRSINNK
jgi:UDP-N-acetylmuramyl pentapeptide phosphotransferase/UDP-N-acetylglucosamine-1-phosphate transferase